MFIQADASNDMAGLYTYDSRTTPAAFDITNLTFTPPQDLTFAQEIRWMVQPMNNGMLGPRSTSTIFYLPNDVGEEINSTHATLSIQEGSIIPSTAYPSVTSDTFLDTGNIYTNRGASSSLGPPQPTPRPTTAPTLGHNEVVAASAPTSAATSISSIAWPTTGWTLT